jgi:hypothetical protein
MPEIQIVQIVAFMRLANRMHGDAKGDVPGDGHMISVSLDIFRKDAQGNPIWIGTTQDMDDARYHLNRLALALPGEYFVFDQRTRQVVASVDGFDGDRHR